MSRVTNKVQTNPVRQQTQKPVQTKKAGEKSVFSKHMGKKPAVKKQQGKVSSQTKKTKGSPLQSQGSAIQSQGDSASTLLKQRGPVSYGRRGGNTVADLQAKLEQSNTTKKGLNASTDGVQVKDDAQAKDGVVDGAVDGKLGGLQDDLKSLDATDGLAVGQPGAQMVQGQQGPGGTTVMEVKGSKISTEMLDKIVDNARVGVNATGAAEFQFDLKGDVLGGLKMRMSMDNGQLNAVFVAENPDIRRFIDKNLDDLKKSLEDRGINIKDIEIRDPEEDQRERKREQNKKDREAAWE